MALIYRDRDRRNAKIRSVTLNASARVTGTGATNGPAIEVGDASTLRLNLVVSAHVGTQGTLDVKVQTSANGSNGWTECTANGATTAAFTQVTTTDGTTRLICTGLDRFVRVVRTLGGTNPDFTFAVTGEAV